jgi:hypothetical protein
MGDNDRLQLTMTADDHTGAESPGGLRRRTGLVLRGGLRRLLKPYARHRTRQAALAGDVARLQAEFKHLQERHTEQIERLEDMVRELVLAMESLRRSSRATDDE